jgi:hypothetical protein
MYCAAPHNFLLHTVLSFDASATKVVLSAPDFDPFMSLQSESAMLSWEVLLVDSMNELPVPSLLALAEYCITRQIYTPWYYAYGKDGFSLLHAAVAQREVELVRALLKDLKVPADIGYQFRCQTPLNSISDISPEDEYGWNNSDMATEETLEIIGSWSRFTRQ